MSSIEEKVIAEIRERARKGEAKYGTTMDRDDLSFVEWVQHLKEELMDAVVYAQKILDYSEIYSNFVRDYDACDTDTNLLSDKKETE